MYEFGETEEVYRFLRCKNSNKDVGLNELFIQMTFFSRKMKLLFSFSVLLQITRKRCLPSRGVFVV